MRREEWIWLGERLGGYYKTGNSKYLVDVAIALAEECKRKKKFLQEVDNILALAMQVNKGRGDAEELARREERLLDKLLPGRR